MAEVAQSQEGYDELGKTQAKHRGCATGIFWKILDQIFKKPSNPSGPQV